VRTGEEQVGLPASQLGMPFSRHRSVDRNGGILLEADTPKEGFTTKEGGSWDVALKKLSRSVSAGQ
jgi:hypothetical protein